MNPILDQFLVGALIIAALAFFVFRALRRDKKCNCDCDCSAQKLKKP